MSTVRIETGLKTYDIENEHGVIIGQVSFNPADDNLIVRAEEAKNNIESLMTNAKEIDESDDLAEEIFKRKLKEIDDKIREQVNYLFGSNVSDVVFGTTNVLTTHNGKTFIERFLEAFMPIIKDEFEKEHQKSMERIEKYTKRIS